MNSCELKFNFLSSAIMDKVFLDDWSVLDGIVKDFSLPFR